MLVGDLLSRRKPFFGEVLVAMGRIAYSQLDEALTAQEKRQAYLGEIMVERGWISSTDIAEALRVQQEYEHLHGLVDGGASRAQDFAAIMASISSGASLDRVLLEIVRQVCSTLGFDRAGIYLLDAKTKLVQGTWGTDAKGEVESIHHVTHPLSADRGFAGIYHQGAPFFFTEDAAAFYRPDSRTHQHSMRHKAIVPMKSAYDIVGFIAVDNLLTERPFGPDDLAPLQVFAGGAALAVSQARISQALQQAEAELRRSEEHFRSLIENATDLIMVLNGDATIRYESPSVESWLGHKPEERMGKNAFEFIHPDDAPGLKRMFAEGVRIAGAVRSTEFRLQHKDGSWRTLEMEAKNLLHDPAVAGVVVNAHDITERKQAAQALQASDARYRELFDNANDAIYTLDLAGNFTSINQAGEQLTGYTSSETPAMNIASLIAPEHLGRAREMIDRKIAGAGPTTYELEIIAWGGRRIPLEVSSRLIYEEGKPVGVQGIARDITERRRTDTLARVSQSLTSTLELDRVLRTIWKETEQLLHPDSFYARVYDEKHGDYVGKLHVDESETSGFRGVEYDVREDRGAADIGFGGWALRHRTTLVVEDTEAEAERLTSLGIERAAPVGSGKRSRSLVVVPILSADELLGVLGVYSYRPSAFSSEDVRLLEGIAGCASAAIRNALLFDELRASNEQLRSLQDQLVQTEKLRALGQMSSGIAHDFNNALSPIMGFSELLLKVPENLENKAKALRYLQAINTAAMDAAHVVSRLREFYRFREQGEIFQPVTMDRLIEQAIDLTQPKWKDEAQAKGASILIQTELQPVPEVAGNESELREALVNLIFNAVDAMPKGGTISIRTSIDDAVTGRRGGTTGPRVVLSVQDTGAGMTEEVRRRCLEPFFTSKGPQGTGLGLSMVYGIIVRHEGTIDIASALGQGTTITLRLPARPQAQTSEQEPTTGELVRPLRVLVVDDDPAVREVTVEYLLAEGHTVETATDGREGLEKFHAGRFDLIVTDRAMPELSGDQLARAIKRRAPSKPIIMLTGFGEFMSAAGEVPPGVDAIVNKPVTLDALRQAIVASFQNVSKTGAPTIVGPT